MVDGGEVDVDAVAASAVEGDGDHVGADRLQLASNLFARGTHDHVGPSGRELGQSGAEGCGQGEGAVAEREAVARRSPHDTDLVEGHEGVAHARVAQHREVGPHRHDRTGEPLTGCGGDRDRARALGKVEEHARHGGVLGGLPLEPVLTGPGPSRVVDPSFGDPAVERGQHITRREVHGLRRWPGVGVHSADHSEKSLSTAGPVTVRSR